jgi:hypothetical protein
MLGFGMSDTDRVCKGCGKELDPDARACPYCGRLSVSRTRDRLRPDTAVEAGAPSEPKPPSDEKEVHLEPAEDSPDSYFTIVGTSPPQEDESEEQYEAAEAPSDTQPSKPKKGCGCLIVTAAFGSESAQEVVKLKETRDRYRQRSAIFSRMLDDFEAVYYTVSPTISSAMWRSPGLKSLIRTTLVEPTLVFLDVLLPRIPRLFCFKQ